MIKSIFYKEWVKSRWALLIILLVLGGVIIYSFMNVSRGLRMAGGQHIWDMIVQKGITFTDFIKYVPLFSGILLALSQYIPEMINKRLKLTLHLPLSESKVLISMIAYGILCLFIIFMLSYGILYAGFNKYFCAEIAQWNMVLTIPWFLGGITAYLLTAWICIEPVWKHKIFNSIIAMLIISLYYFDALPETYNPLLIYLIVLLLVSISFSYHSLVRFKDGEQ